MYWTGVLCMHSLAETTVLLLDYLINDPISCSEIDPLPEIEQPLLDVRCEALPLHKLNSSQPFTLPIGQRP